MRRGWLRRNRLTTTLPHTILLCGRVWLLLLAAFNFQVLHTQPAPSQNQVHFFGEVSERRPWDLKREDRPAPSLPGVLNRSLAGLFNGWDSALAYTSRVSYPTRLPPQHAGPVKGKECTNAVREKLADTFGGKQCHSLQLVQNWIRRAQRKLGIAKSYLGRVVDFHAVLEEHLLA